MATIESPSQQGSSVEVDRTFAAVRTSLRPLDYIQYGTGGQVRVGGHYKWIAGITAQAWATSAVILSQRNLDSSALIVLLRINVIAYASTAITAQLMQPVTPVALRGFTSNYTTNASGVFLLSGSRARSNMPYATASGVQVASAAAGMTGATNTTENAFGGAGLQGIAGLGTGIQADAYNCVKNGEHPMVFGPNEGWMLQMGNAIATGSLGFSIGIEWAEVPVF